MNKKLIIFCLALAVAAMSLPAQAQSYANTVISDGPLSFWEFEDASTADEAVCADTMNFRNGTYQNINGNGTYPTPVLSVPGLVGQAAYFTGDSNGTGTYVDVWDNSYNGDYPPGLELQTLSIELLMKSSTTSNYPRLVQHENGTNNGYGIGGAGGQITVLGCGSTWYTAWPPSFDGAWHHIVVTYAYNDPNTTESWYIDGVLGYFSGTRTIAGFLSYDTWSDTSYLVLKAIRIMFTTA